MIYYLHVRNCFYFIAIIYIFSNNSCQSFSKNSRSSTSNHFDHPYNSAEDSLRGNLNPGSYGSIDSIRQAEPNSIFNLSYLNNGEQVYFPNGKMVDFKDYAFLINSFPKETVMYDTLEDGRIGSRNRGVEIDMQKCSIELKNKLIGKVKLFGNARINDVKWGRYNGQIAWNSAEIGFPFIVENIVFFNETEAIGETGRLIVFDSLGNIVHEIDCSHFGLYSANLTLDAKYLCIYSGYYSEYKESIPERYRIYDFASGNLIWETSNLPAEFGSPVPQISGFYSKGYFFYPERKKVYHQRISMIDDMKEFTNEGLFLSNGKFLNFESDWQIISFGDFNKRTNIID